MLRKAMCYSCSLGGKIPDPPKPEPEKTEPPKPQSESEPKVEPVPDDEPTSKPEGMDVRVLMGQALTPSIAQCPHAFTLVNTCTCVRMLRCFQGLVCTYIL